MTKWKHITTRISLRSLQMVTCGVETRQPRQNLALPGAGNLKLHSSLRGSQHFTCCSVALLSLLFQSLFYRHTIGYSDEEANQPPGLHPLKINLPLSILAHLNLFPPVPLLLPIRSMQLTPITLYILIREGPFGVTAPKTVCNHPILCY